MLRRVWVVQQREAYYRYISFWKHKHHRDEDAVVPTALIIKTRPRFREQRRGSFGQCRVTAGGIFVLVALGRKTTVVEDQLWPRAARQSWYSRLPMGRDQ